MNIISVENLTYSYPTDEKEVLKNISFDIEKGKLYSIIGKNDSGKTTLCNVLRGFIPHYYDGDLTGNISILGKDIREWELDELSDKIGYIFQNPFAQITGVRETVFAEIAYGLENLGINKEEIIRRVENIIKLLGIESIKNKNPNNLSGGQKQRVAFASVIAMEPEILIIDEPTSQLDPIGTHEIYDIINIMKERGATIILVEHKLELIAEYADYILLLQDGELKIKGDAQDVLSNEKVLDYNGTLPIYALLGIEMQKHDKNIKEIPITRKEAIEYIRPWLESYREGEDKNGNFRGY